MNGVFRLLANFDFNSARAATPEARNSDGGEEFALRIANASAESSGDRQDVLATAVGGVEQDSPDDHVEDRPQSIPVLLPSAPETMPLLPVHSHSVLNSIPGANGRHGLTISAEPEASETGDVTKEIKPQLPLDLIGGVRVTDIPVLSKLTNSAVRPDSVKPRSDIPVEVQGVSKNQPLLLDNHPLGLPIDKPEPKNIAKEPPHQIFVSGPAPVNHTAPAITSLPVTDVVANAPMPTGTAASTPSSLMTFDITMDDRWIDRLGQEIARLTGDNTRLSFQLKPQHLGKLHVEIISDAAGNIVRVDTDNESAKMLILGAQGRLEQDIRLAGSKLLRVDVTEQEHSGLASGDRDASAQHHGSTTNHGDRRWHAGLSDETGWTASVSSEFSSSHDGVRYA